MKKLYTRPRSKAVRITVQTHLFESSYIPTGGKGPFDVKEEKKDGNFWSEENPD